MQLSFRRTLPFDADRVWALLCSEEWDRKVAQDHGQARTPLGESRDGERFTRRTRVEGRPLPELGRKVFGIERLAYELTEVYEPSTRSIAWSVHPAALASKVTARGSYRIDPAPDGCQRTMTGEITVNVPLVGGKVEGIIAGELEGAFARTTELLQRELSSR